MQCNELEGLTTSISGHCPSVQDRAERSKVSLRDACVQHAVLVLCGVVTQRRRPWLAAAGQKQTGCDRSHPQPNEQGVKWLQRAGLIARATWAELSMRPLSCTVKQLQALLKSPCGTLHEDVYSAAVISLTPVSNSLWTLQSCTASQADSWDHFALLYCRESC